MPMRPGGALATRPLHFIWIADCSSSMSGSKIQALNFAIRDAIPHMQRVAAENVNAQVFVRAIAFGSRAAWHVADPTPAETFQWFDLEPNGMTAMGAALTLLAEALDIEKMGTRALPPVLVLVTDGQPTDDFQAGLRKLMHQGWAKKAVRLAIAIGEDAQYEPLVAFTGNPEMVMSVSAPEQMMGYVKWVSTVAVQSASNPASQMAMTGSGNVAIPAPPAMVAGSVSANAVW